MENREKALAAYWETCDWHEYALEAIRLGLTFTDDLMVNHRGQAAVEYWRAWGELLPWE